MASKRTICVHCERYMSMIAAAEFFSYFGEVSSIEIFREPANFVYVRFFDDGTIITAWEVPVGVDKAVPVLGCQDAVTTLDESSDNCESRSSQALLKGNPATSTANYEIELEKLLAGQDRRTTIMVRNLPKKGKPSEFIDALKSLDLWSSLNFYYMPFDKSRGRFCGFAFLDFRDLVDILRFSHAKLPEQLMPNGPLGISYAHIQGLPSIHANFSDSLIMDEPDESKRPIFLTHR
eukprot:TRINITY_DN36477_c0_g1_i1.p1 TRINITY_DN36477_c0_g1~~TRINITY_DN36477_c0_g1_i1.p1  ORF type:complete len:235 (+),score=30.94 TRINITY_DN36477_c0_g1_i1:225-929(+)